MAYISVTMTAAFTTTAQINVFDQGIFIIITGLKRNINSAYTEIVKRFDFKKFTKEYLQGRTETLIINTKIGNKKPSGIWTLNPLLMAQKR